MSTTLKDWMRYDTTTVRGEPLTAFGAHDDFEVDGIAYHPTTRSGSTATRRLMFELIDDTQCSGATMRLAEDPPNDEDLDQWVKTGSLNTWGTVP